jgi:hypothetical protein
MTRLLCERKCFVPLALFVAFGCSPAVIPPPTTGPLLVEPSTPPTKAALTDPIRAEAKRRQEALLEQGFNLTHGWTLSSSDPNPLDLEFVVPPPSEDHLFSFWADVGASTVDFRLVGPDGQLVAAWAGHHGEVSVSLEATPGHYTLQLSRSQGAGGRALFGSKGPTLSRCQAPTGGTVREVAATDAKGFHWPYFLYVPKDVRMRRLLVLPDNTGFATEDLELLRLSGSCEIASHAALADQLGTPVLVPLFPRPSTGKGDDDNLYLHALSRSALETRIEACRRVDLQLVAMIADALVALHAEHVDVEAKVLMQGFSASAMFVNRFAFLHPETVRAVVVGSPGGWPIAPLRDVEGEALNYPVGIADVAALTGKAVDIAGVRQVSWFFIMGDKDENDAVTHRDSFSANDERVIFRRFGATPVSRWRAAERMYKSAGLNARFSLYHGVAHSLSREMDADVGRFFAETAGTSQ